MSGLGVTPKLKEESVSQSGKQSSAAIGWPRPQPVWAYRHTACISG